jgi:hypothetical protein
MSPRHPSSYGLTSSLAAAVLFLPAVAAQAARAPRSIGPSEVTSPVRCVHPPEGLAKDLIIYTEKGQHPAKAALTCARGEAVLTVGLKSLGSNQLTDLGSAVSVDGVRYTFAGFTVPGSNDKEPAFIGAGTVVVEPQS